MNPRSEDLVAQITMGLVPPNEVWRERARMRLDTLTKPLGSLGRLEDLASQMVAIRQEKLALPLGRSVYVFAADHGVTAEGVSAYPSEVTHQMVLNFLAGGAAINVLAHLHGVALTVVDVGVDADFVAAPGLLDRKVRKGTRNMRHEAAMTDEELAQALRVGAELAAEAARSGQAIVAIGEMGIGNTTSASAITCALTGAHESAATGRGTGVDAEAHAHKAEVVAAIIARCGAMTPLEILRNMGGLEIAAMAGMVLGAATHGLAVVCDGFISTAAAALAASIDPRIKNYLIAGHKSQEPGHKLLLERLGLAPILSLDMRLGEGTGAVLAMPVIESAVALYLQMATFASAGVSEAGQ